MPLVERRNPDDAPASDGHFDVRERPEPAIPPAALGRVDRVHTAALRHAPVEDHVDFLLATERTLERVVQLRPLAPHDEDETIHQLKHPSVRERRRSTAPA